MIADKQFLWCERYRPHTVKDCILPDELKKPFQEYVDQKKIPNLILSGTAGVGKTTIARAMCEEIDADYIMLNGSTERNIDTIRGKVQGFSTSVSLAGGRKVIIMDEADNLTGDAQKALRGVIEDVSENCTFIFTCNFVNKIIDPIHSRCAVIKFKLNANQKQAMALAFMKRVRGILDTEQIKFDPKVVAELIQKFFPDYRRILNELQHYSVGGVIDVGILSNVNDASLGEMFGYIKAKNYKDLRQWVGRNSDVDSTQLMRSIYDKLSDNLAPASVPIAIVLLGKYQYQAAFVADQEVNLMAFLTEIMIECEMK